MKRKQTIGMMASWRRESKTAELLIHSDVLCSSPPRTHSEAISGWAREQEQATSIHCYHQQLFIISVQFEIVFLQISHSFISILSPSYAPHCDQHIPEPQWLVHEFIVIKEPCAIELNNKSVGRGGGRYVFVHNELNKWAEGAQTIPQRQVIRVTLRHDNRWGVMK